MTDKLLLVGAGGLGRTVLEHVIHKYDCAFLDDGYEVGTEICGVKVVGRLSDLGHLFSKYRLLLVTIGNNDVRKKIMTEALEIGYELISAICQSSYISPFSKIGKGCIILNNVCIQNGSVVGEGVILNPGVEIHHDSRVDDYVLIYTNSVIRTGARVKSNVKIGSNCTVSNNQLIGNDTVINDGVTI